MSNDFKFLTFDGRLFHSLGDATEYDKYSHSNVPLIKAGVYQFITWLMINTCFMTVRVIESNVARFLVGITMCINCIQCQTNV